MQLLAQGTHVLLQTIYLLLLTKYGSIERIEKILCKAHFCLNLVQSGVHHSLPVAGS